MNVEDYYNKIKNSPGGLDYFHSWVKFYSDDKEHYKVNIVDNFFRKKKEERKKLNELAEKIFCEKAEKYINEYLPRVENDLAERDNLKNIVKSNYLKIKKLAGGYYSFYGWVRETYPELKGKGFSETTIRNLIYQSRNHRFIKDYGELAGKFNVLIEEYLKIIEDKDLVYESDITNIPKEVLTSFHQYFLFFTEYLERVKSMSINFNVLRTENGLKFRIKTENKEEINEIKNHLDEYISIARNVILEGKDLAEILNDLNLLETSKLRLETELNHLKTTLKIVELENKYLKNSSDFLKELTIKMAEQNPTITNQMITDGNQQFADKIENIKK